MKTITITFSWEQIHELFTSLDNLRRPLGLGTVDLHYDVFGGCYYGPTFEVGGLCGIISLSSGLDRLSREVWNKLHDLIREVRARSCSMEHAIELARKLVAVALAIAAAKQYLHSIGLRGDPAQEICGTGDGAVMGLHWLAGAARDNGATIAEMTRFVEQGVSALTEPLK